MAKLVKAVFVKDPDRHRTVLLHPGEEPEPRLAALVTNPDAWEDGKPPATGTPEQERGSDDSKPAAKKTAASKRAASKPARGRDAADEGSSGD
jgi:hypothetical protein